MVKELSGNAKMELRKEDANGIVRWKWKAKDLRKTDHGNGIGNGKWKWKMENGIWKMEDGKWNMENLQAMLYYSVYTLWLWMSEIVQKLNGK